MSRSASGLLSKLVLVALSFGALWANGCGSGKAPDPLPENDTTPGEQNLGERIFVDTRFAQYFAQNMTGVNDPLAVGDPVVAQVSTPAGVLPGPFAGQSINCRSCHFVTEFTDNPNVRNRTYADFVDHSPIPRNITGFTSTPRNAMQMVGSLQPRNGPIFLHFDGEFTTPEDLVQSTITGRNFGWSPDQYTQAVAHIARVIREDNGTNAGAITYGCGLTYAKIFLGTDPNIPVDCRIAPQFKIDVTTASDEAIVEKVAGVVAAYAEGLLFKQDELGRIYCFTLRRVSESESFAHGSSSGRNASSICAAPVGLNRRFELAGVYRWELRQLPVSSAAICFWRNRSARTRDFLACGAGRDRWFSACWELRRLPPAAGFHGLPLS